MRKRIFSVLLCFCMALSLLPVAALAAEYDGWEAATAEGVTLTADTDKVTIGGVAYTYKGDISNSGLQTTNTDYKFDGSSEIYKAGGGYVLLIWPSAAGNPVTLTLHNASITTSTAGISIFAQVNVTLEGDNSITAHGNGLESCNSQPNLDIGGSGSLTANAGSYALNAKYQGSASDTLTIQDSAHLTLIGSTGICSGTVTIKGSSVVDITATDYAIQNAYDTNAIHVFTDTAQVTAKGETPFFMLYGTVNVDSGVRLNGIRTDDTSYTVYGTVTVPENKTLDLSSATSLGFQNGASIVNNGTIKLPSGYTLNDINAMNLSGNGVLQIGAKAVAFVDGVPYFSGGDVSTSGLNLSTNVPTETTYYKARSGYALFTPATTTPAAPAKLTLHNATIHNTASINDETGVGIALPDGAVIIAVEGANTVSAQSTNAISGSNTDVTLSGSGALNVGHSGIALKSTAANPHSFTKGTNVNLNGIVLLYDNSSESGAADTNTVYGSVIFPSGFNYALLGTVTVPQGATMTIPQGATLVLEDTTSRSNNGTILNNGTIALLDGTGAAAIKALKLTGTGIVKAGSNYYTNDGAAVKEITGGLTLTGTASGTTVDHDGYSWDGSTLTLGNAYVEGGLTLPDHATINTTSGSTISGTISGPGGTPMHLTFKGTKPLTINGVISLGSNNDTLTVQDGAQVTVNGGVSLGAYGLDGALNVSGSGTMLSISSDSSYAVMCGAVNVQNGASLTAHSEGSHGLYALASGVSVTGGSTLTVGCDYGVYVKDGTFTLDESSTFTANAAVAAVCVVDTTKTKSQSQTLNVPSSMLPGGTKITKAVGNTVGCGYTYWSIANSANTITATNEAVDPATLAGALGALTLKKVSSPTGGGGSASGCTLTFATNGGSSVASLSKTSGTVIDLSAYVPTRDGYAFAGWYSDASLNTKVTSVTLTKSTTVYARWTAKSANPFADVSDNAYYHDAVLWAMEKNITGGTSNTTFSPHMTCTRAQMVTFLWRADGSPKPISASCPFADVASNAYYYNAVLWAIEKGITAGTSSTTFGPYDTVTRGQAVTLLWNAAGKPETTSSNPFGDVSKDAYYHDAVLWAVKKGITQGISSASFRPKSPCTRSQIVTFLYRSAGK